MVSFQQNYLNTAYFSIFLLSVAEWPPLTKPKDPVPRGFASMKGSDDVIKTVSQLQFGDLIEVEWWDHSKREIRLKPKGRKRYLVFDVPVKSVGIFFGVAGEEAKHIVLARDVFIWPSMGDFDIDATAILLGVTKRIRVIARRLLNPKLATQLKGAWERGQVRIVKRGKHMRLRISEVPER